MSLSVQEVNEAKARALAEIGAAESAAEVEELRVKYISRNGLVPEFMKSMKDVAPADKPAMGVALNALRTEITDALTSRKSELVSSGNRHDTFDFSLPGNWPRAGAIHPVSSVIEETARIFGQLGFTVADGPDIETEFNNFDALNTAAHHPSRDPADTFWLEDGRLLRKIGRASCRERV